MAILLIILGVVAIYFTEGYIYKVKWKKNLSAKIHFSTESITAGQKVLLFEEVTNKKSLPLISTAVKFRFSRSFIPKENTNLSCSDQYYRKDVFSLLGYQKITRTHEFIASKRGYYFIDEININITNLFLNRKFVERFKNDANVYVFPKQIKDKYIPISIKSIIGDMTCKKYMIEDPFEFRGIREYQPYDKFNSINWKSTAKTQKLMVKEFNSTQSYNIKLLLNVEKNKVFDDEEIIEDSISIISTLARNYLKQNILVNFDTNGVDKYGEKVQSGDIKTKVSEHMDINKALARIDLNKKPIDFVKLVSSKLIQRNSSSLIIIVSNYRHADLINMFNNIGKKHNNVLWILPHYNNEDVNSEIRNSKSIYQWEMNDEHKKTKIR